MTIPAPNTEGLLAIDVGNSRVKLGWFAGVGADCSTQALGRQLPIAGPLLPEPIATLGGAADELVAARLPEWLTDVVGEAPSRVAIASVSPSNERAIVAALPAELDVVRLASERAPIELRVAEPGRIGVDRVMAAVAANRLRHAARAAIVVDLGTAITVDLVAADGALEGGAILPGPGLAGRVLAEGTDALPDLRFGDLDASPDAVGRDTESAIEAGVYWGTVGAVRELIARQADRLTEPPQVFLTGGASPAVARLLGGPDLAVRHMPHLTLAGIALTALGVIAEGRLP